MAEAAPEQFADAQRMVDFHKSQAAVHRENLDAFNAMAKTASDRLTESSRAADDAQAALDKLKTAKA